MPKDAKDLSTVTIALYDWQYDKPQEGSRTLILTTSRTIVECIFHNNHHKNFHKGIIYNKHQVIAWIYVEELLNKMLNAVKN